MVLIHQQLMLAELGFGPRCLWIESSADLAIDHFKTFLGAFPSGLVLPTDVHPVGDSRAMSFVGWFEGLFAIDWTYVICW